MLKFLSTTRNWKCTLLVAQTIALALAIAPAGTAAAGSGAWWNVTPEEETPSSQYDSILYSEIAPKLREIEVNSTRVKIDVIGNRPRRQDGLQAEFRHLVQGDGVPEIG